MTSPETDPADAAEQQAPAGYEAPEDVADEARADPAVRDPEADPADVAEQDRAVPLPEEER